MEQKKNLSLLAPAVSNAAKSISNSVAKSSVSANRSETDRLRIEVGGYVAIDNQRNQMYLDMYNGASNPIDKMKIALMANNIHKSTDPIALLELSMKRLEQEQLRRTAGAVLGISAGIALGYLIYRKLN